jgi:hypothetical protein
MKTNNNKLLLESLELQKKEGIEKVKTLRSTEIEYWDIDKAISFVRGAQTISIKPKYEEWIFDFNVVVFDGVLTVYFKIPWTYTYIFSERRRRFYKDELERAESIGYNDRF